MAELPDAMEIFENRPPVAAILMLAACVAGQNIQLRFWRDTKTLFTPHARRDQKQRPGAYDAGGRLRARGSERRRVARISDSVEMRTILMVQVAGGRKKDRLPRKSAAAGTVCGTPGNTHARWQPTSKRWNVDPGLVEAHNNLGNLLDTWQARRGTRALSIGGKLAAGHAARAREPGTQFVEPARLRRHAGISGRPPASRPWIPAPFI